MLKVKIIIFLLGALAFSGFVSGIYLVGRSHENTQWENKLAKEVKKTNERNQEIESRQKQILLTPRSPGVIDGCLRRACA